jgi:hypothetical protein
MALCQWTCVCSARSLVVTSRSVRTNKERVDIPASSAPPTGYQLNGLIERVTFFSEESGFCVLRVKADGHRDLVTVIGSVPSVSPGEWITAEGDWVIDKEHAPHSSFNLLWCFALRGSENRLEISPPRDELPDPRYTRRTDSFSRFCAILEVHR